MKKYLLILSMTFLVASSVARQNPIEKDLEFQVHSIDSAAEAIILFDIGESKADFDGTKFTRHSRLKILKHSAMKEWGSLSFDIVKKGKLRNFSATVYNSVNGLTEAVTIDENSVMKNKSGETLKISVAFPKVSVGSVVEFQYTIVYQIYYLPSWQFQFSIPVIASEYKLFCPFVKGCQPDVIGSVDGLKHETRLNGKEQMWRLKNIPPFEPEPFMPPERFYRAGLNFEFYVYFDWAKALEAQDSRSLFRKTSKTVSKSTVLANFKIESNRLCRGEVKITRDGANSAEARENCARLGEEAYKIQSLNNPDFSIVKGSIQNLIDTSKSVIENYELIVDFFDITAGKDSAIMFNPFVFMKEDFNPLRSSVKRKYPVYFGGYREEVVIYKFSIPNDYSILNLPETKGVEMTGSLARSIVNVSAVGNEIFITTKLILDKPVFMPNEYPALREFFDRTLEMKSSPIILTQKK